LSINSSFKKNRLIPKESRLPTVDVAGAKMLGGKIIYGIWGTQHVENHHKSLIEKRFSIKLFGRDLIWTFA